MEINVLQLLFKNKIRQYIRFFKKNKIECIFTAMAGCLLVFYASDFFKIALSRYFPLVSLLFFLYCAAKLFQELPIMNIDYRLFDFRIIKLWHLKAIVFLRSIILSGFIFILMLIFSGSIDNAIFYKILLLLLVNMTVNLICFLKSQTNYTTLLIIATLLIITFGYYFNSIIMISVFLTITSLYFILRKSLKYDRLLPYYHSLAYLSQGLVNNDMDSVMQGQLQFNNQKDTSSLHLMEKYYGRGFMFNFFKEISRVSYGYKNVINSSLINFLITIFIAMYPHPKWAVGVAMLAIIIVSDYVLTTINKAEVTVKNKGFYLPYTLGDIIKQKYLVHLCILLLPFLAGILIIRYVNIFLLILCFLILPIKNILHNFSNKFSIKCAVYILDSIMFLLISLLYMF